MYNVRVTSLTYYLVINVRS